jgi:hypothetical protein
MNHWPLPRDALFLCVLGLTLVACTSSPPTTPSPPGYSSPAVSPDSKCYLLPQPTGEKIIPVTIGTPPPPQAQPGETISLSFSGGYLIVNNARVCGDNEVVGYIYADELPGFSYRRTVRVSIDKKTLAELECDYDCRVEVTIPDSTGQGLYRLRLGPPFGFRGLDFDLEIRASKSP